MVRGDPDPADGGQLPERGFPARELACVIL